MAYCPNRWITKRVGRGGGEPKCRGSLELVLSIPIVLRAKRLPKLSQDRFDKVALYNDRNFGVKVRPDQLARLYTHSRDIRCNTCGWSLAKLESQVRKTSKTLVRKE